MSPDLILLIVYGAVFAAILLFVEGFYYLVTDNRAGVRQRNINRRMQWLAEGVDRSVVMSRLRRKSPTDTEGFAGQIAKLSTVQRLDGLLARAGLSIHAHRFLGRCLVGGALLGFILVAFHVPFVIALVMAATASIGLPVFVVSRKAARRTARMEDQLPDALDMIVRSLRAGHPIATAINLVARELADPLGSEFGLVADEMAFGIDLRGALENMSARIELSDMRFMVMTIKMQAVTGGNLAEVLGTLARLIRERHRLHLKVLALSSEGRFSMKILSGLPFAFFALISVVQPKYYAGVFTNPTLTHLFEVGLVMIAIGIYLMRRIVNFRV